MIELDALDRRIIRRLGGDFGDAEYPFAALAGELGCPEEEVIARIARYRDTGAMRRIGAVLRHQQAGFTANGMSAWNVPAADVDRVGEALAACPEITHCYERPRLPGFPYNLYGMIHGESKAACLAVAARVASEVGIDDYTVLFSTREFKKTSMVYYRGDP